MRRRSLAALGACTSASAAFCALLTTTGVVGTSIAVLVAPPFSAPAAATGLRSFAGCEELRQWYVDTALPSVGPWGLGWPGYLTDGLVARTALSSPAVATPVAASAVDAAVPGDAVGNGDTGTNLQEAGVDEPDVAKTDGSVVVHVDGRRLVVTDVTGERPRELSRTRLPGRLADAELLLVDDTVLVLGSDGYPGYPAYRDVMPAPGMVDSGQPRGPHSRLLAVDIGDPSDPVVTEQQRLDGALVTAREYDGTVRVVVSTGAPALDFVHPTRHRTPRQARQENRRIVRETTIDDWLPHVDDGSGRERLVDCDQVRHPEEPSGLGTITVLTFDADAPAERSSTAVTTGGDLVYSSTDRLYVGTIRSGRGDPVPVTGRRDSGRAAPPAPGVLVHAFALEGDRARYVASGEVPGTVRDRWSFSEYDGHLRVATALGNRSWDPRENAVVVLEERGTELVEVGRVGDLGPGEQIQSVRWFGALAVVVTFRQTDPLYTLDLSAPAEPRLLGTLKIPGFSSYLHPVGDGLLLGLGQDATRAGRTRGAQAAVFDLSDLRHPRRTDTVAFARHTELAAAWDSRAFTYLPEQRVAVTTVQDVWNGRTRLAVLRVGSDGSLTGSATERLDRWSGPVRALPVGDRVAVVSGGEVRLVSV